MNNFHNDSKFDMNKPLYVVTMVSRNKDNKHIEGFSERHESFVTQEDYDGEHIARYFKSFVARGLPGEMCRLYYSVNGRDAKRTLKAYLTYIIEKETINLVDPRPIIAKLASTREFAVTKKFFFDFDIDSEAKVLEFIEDIKAIDDSVEIIYRKTPHGYAVVTSHGFDTRRLFEKWDKSLVGLNRDAVLLIKWEYTK